VVADAAGVGTSPRLEILMMVDGGRAKTVLTPLRPRFFSNEFDPHPLSRPGMRMGGGKIFQGGGIQRDPLPPKEVKTDGLLINHVPGVVFCADFSDPLAGVTLRLDGKRVGQIMPIKR